MKSSSTRKKKGKKPRRAQLSDQQKTSLLVLVCGILVLAGGYWVYDMMMAPPVPDPEKAPAKEITNYLADRRGLWRMPIEERRRYLERISLRYTSDEQLANEAYRALRQMSRGERQVILDATFEIGKKDFMRAADDYARTPPRSKRKFVDKVIRNFEGFRMSMLGFGGGGGGGGGGTSLAGAFEDTLPTKSDAYTKMLVQRTTGRERARAKPLIDAISERVDELDRNPRLRDQVLGGG